MSVSFVFLSCLGGYGFDGFPFDIAIWIKFCSGGGDFPENDIAPYEHLIEVCVPLKDESKMHLTDYASAGKLWNDKAKIAAWILTV